jgi:hypothetical protein
VARVLILEPNTDLRELISRVVSRLGHEPIAPATLPVSELAPLDALLLEPTWVPALELARGLRESDSAGLFGRLVSRFCDLLARPLHQIGHEPGLEERVWRSL